MLVLLAILALAAAPAAFLFYYFWVRDRWEKEPWLFLLILAAWGGVSVIPAAIFEVGLLGLEMEFESIGEAFYAAFIVAGLVEETIKFIFVYFLTLKSPYFREEYDGIIYAVAVGLGFAFVENLAYIGLAFATGGGGVTVAVLRAFTAVPMHALDGVILGFFIGRARFQSSAGQRFSTMLLGLILAIAFHGLYDFFGFSTMVLPERVLGWCLVGIVWIMVVQWATAHRFVRTAQERSALQHVAMGTFAAKQTVEIRQYNGEIAASKVLERPVRERRFCRYCGNRVEVSARFCRSCGKELM